MNLCSVNLCPVNLLLRRASFIFFLVSAVGGWIARGATAAEDSDEISVIKGVGESGVGHRDAQEAILRIQKQGPRMLIPVLQGMQGATPISKNWLRMLAADLSDDAPLPREELTRFFEDRQQDPDARYLVYRWLTDSDEELQATVLERSTDDPSLPLRFLANRRLMDQAAAAGTEEKETAIALYQRVLKEARNPDQLQRTVTALSELGQTVDLAKELGMFQRWYLIGPFDSTGGAGFATPYAPELALIESQGASFDPTRSEAGKSADVSWQIATTSDALGSLDLNPIFANEKEAVVYAFCRFTAEEVGELDARLGSTNGNKLWVNGQLITANEVYHTGGRVDQYIGSCEIKKGENWVLVKICQNNQTEAWAQEYQFQFRITDSMGKPIACTVTTPAEQ
jgi:hypothetical protein